MNRVKAWFVAGVMVILAGGFIWSLMRYSVWSYYTVMQVLGWYGLFQAGVHFAGWLQKDEGRHSGSRINWDGQ